MNRRTYFFVSQEYTDDARPSVDDALQPADRARARRRLLADPHHERHHSADHRPADWRGSSRATSFPPDRISPLGQTMLNLLPMPNGILNLAPGQEWTSNSAYDTTPEHSRTNNVVRIDQVFTDKTRASFKILKDRDDDVELQQLHAGHRATSPTTRRASSSSSTITQVLRPTIVNEMNFGYTHNRWGSMRVRRPRSARTSTTRRCTRRSSGSTRRGCSRSATTRIRRSLRALAGRRWTSGRTRPVSRTSGGNRAGLAGLHEQLRLPAARD